MRIGIVGHFGLGQTLRNGQTIKTVTLADGLEKYAGAELLRVDTCGWSQNPIKLLLGVCKAFRDCEAVIMLPAHNGVKVFAPLLAAMNKIYHKKIFYDVVGGWLPKLLEEQKNLRNTLKSFDGIWVETSTMKCALEAQGFSNILVVPNFKDLEPLEESELVYNQGLPLKLCTFSRVMREKGIETLARTVQRINESQNGIGLTLDIYGQVDREQQAWFDVLRKDFPGYIAYRGIAAPEESVELLKSYGALVFPTHFYTEGIPGTIIDAYGAGIPVISAKWESYSDIVQEGKTGLGYSFDNTEELENLLLELIERPERLQSMKIDCLRAVRDYQSEYAVTLIADVIGCA